MAQVVDEQGIPVPVPTVSTPTPSPLPTPDGVHSTPNTGKGPRVGRRSKFNNDEDFIIVQEVMASEAHIAPHGETASRFEAATQKCLLNPNFRKQARQVKSKCIQDRYKKLLEDFETRDKDDHNRSGTGGEIGEMDNLMGEMSQARKDADAAKNRSSEERTAQEEKKLAAGQLMILNSLKGKERKRNASDDGSSGTPPTPKRVRRDDDDGLKAIGEAVRASDASRLEVERSKITLERERLVLEKEERSADREERKEEREERVAEMRAQRDMMVGMTSQNATQMQSLMSLVKSVLEKKE